MMEFRAVTFASLAVIFTSVFFVHFVFNIYVGTIELCSVQSGIACMPTNLFFLFIFSFSIVISFIVLIETTIYFMFKQVQMELEMGSERGKRLGKTLESLEREREEIEMAKKAAQKKYMNRQIGAETLKSMKQKYDSEIMDIEIQVKEMKRKVLKEGWF